jgi:hypothetical protein
MKIRAERYAIVSASALCPACGRWTHVVALVAPQQHACWGEQGWEPVAERASIFYVTDLSASVSRRLASLNPWYRKTAASPEACYANHCEHCAQALEDHDLHCEPGAAFQPETVGAAKALSLWDIEEALDADASGFSHDPDF